MLSTMTGVVTERQQIAAVEWVLFSISKARIVRSRGLKIRDLRATHTRDRVKVAATIVWEDVVRENQEV
jgi:hypothetical protein